jgi:hypothetical protein
MDPKMEAPVIDAMNNVVVKDRARTARITFSCIS